MGLNFSICDADRKLPRLRSQEQEIAITVLVFIKSDTQCYKKTFDIPPIMILNSLSDTRSIEVMTIAGRERGIVFLGKTFVADKSYDTLDDAIAATKKDIDLGVAVVITPDADQFRVWILVPDQMILQAA